VMRRCLVCVLFVLCSCSQAAFYSTLTETPIDDIDSLAWRYELSVPDTSLWREIVLIGDDSVVIRNRLTTVIKRGRLYIFILSKLKSSYQLLFREERR
jgi:hypothetical protein